MTAPHAIVPVWGAAHVAGWLGCLQSWGGLFADLGADLHVYTRQADADKLRLALEALGLQHAIHAVPDARVATTHPGSMMTDMHQMGMDAAGAAGAPALPLCADLVFGADAFAAVAKAARNGARACMAATGWATAPLPLGATSAALAARQAELAWTGGAALWRWSDKPYRPHPSVVHWQAGAGGYLERRFHLHPIYVHPRRRHQFRSVDNDLVENAGIVSHEIAYMNDCTKFMCVARVISDGGDPHGHLPAPPEATLGFHAAWARQWVREFGIECFRVPYWVHGGNLDPALAAAVQVESDLIARSIAALWKEEK